MNYQKLLTSVRKLLVHNQKLLTPARRLLMNYQKLLTSVRKLLVHNQKLLTPVRKLLVHNQKLLTPARRLLPGDFLLEKFKYCSILCRQFKTSLHPERKSLNNLKIRYIIRSHLRTCQKSFPQHYRKSSNKKALSELSVSVLSDSAHSLYKINTTRMLHQYLLKMFPSLPAQCL
jgi:hypothetical protein